MVGRVTLNTLIVFCLMFLYRSLVMIFLRRWIISCSIWRKCLFVSLFDWGLTSIQEFFSHMETSVFSVKGCTFWPILGTHGNCAALVLKRAAPTATCIFRTYSEDSWYSCGQAFGSGDVTTCFNELGLSRPWIEPQSTTCEPNALPRSHCGSQLTIYNCSKVFWYYPGFLPWFQVL